MNKEKVIVRKDSFKNLHELAGICEASLVQKSLKQRENGTSSSEVHKAVDTVTSSPERQKNPERCAKTLGIFWESFKDLPSVKSRFEEDDVQSLMEAGYSKDPNVKLPELKLPFPKLP